MSSSYYMCIVFTVFHPDLAPIGLVSLTLTAHEAKTSKEMLSLFFFFLKNILYFALFKSTPGLFRKNRPYP